jgi:hypothetical protein
MRARHTHRTLGAVAVLIASVTGCKMTSAPKTTALVRYIHAVTNGGPFDFYTDGTREVNGLEFQSATDYFVIDSGSAVPFEVTRINAGASAPLITTNEQVLAAHTYTFMIADSMSDLTPLFIADSNTAPSKTAVKLRLIHAAPSFRTVDIYIVKEGAGLGAAPTMSDVNFETVSTYQVVAPGSYEIVYTAPGNPSAVAADDTLASLGSGTVRTIILMDSKTGTLPLSTVTVNDATR